jgi:hypothetical protein
MLDLGTMGAARQPHCPIPCRTISVLREFKALGLQEGDNGKRDVHVIYSKTYLHVRPQSTACNSTPLACSMSTQLFHPPAWPAPATGPIINM